MNAILIQIEGIWNDSKERFNATAAIGQYDGVSEDDHIFYWFDNYDMVVGEHEDFTVLSYDRYCFSGQKIPTKENWGVFGKGEEFAFTSSQTGMIMDDGTVFYDHEGLNHYIFKNKKVAAEYFFNGEKARCLHSFYIGSREQHPTLEGWCKRMGIELDEDEDGSCVFSAYKEAVA